MSPTKLLPAFGYVRVSTDEQAEHQTSLQSQINTIQIYAKARGFEIITMFVEPGRSGTDHNRPKFRDMIEQATDAAKPVVAIFAVSMSRIARSLELTLTTDTKLRKAGVKLLYVTEEFGEDSPGRMMRNLKSMFNEHFADETSHHTRRTMRANAVDGYYNGGKVPFGYESKTVEIRGKKEKRKLFVNPEEAEVVRLIYNLAENGLASQPMGGRNIAEYLNQNGYRLRGNIFHNSSIDGVLKRPIYAGRYADMTLDEFGLKRPEEEWVWVDCPVIIDPAQVARVAALRSSRSPRVIAPKIVAGPTLLTGKAICGCAGCGSGLVLATGKSGQYRYYKCRLKTNAGHSICDSKAIRAETLDTIVVNALIDKVFAADRLPALLSKILEVSDTAREQRLKELAQVKAQRTSAETAMSRLLSLVEQGLMTANDPSLAGRISEHRQTIAQSNQRTRLLEQLTSQSKPRITPAMIEKFGQMARNKLRSNDAMLRRNYVHMFVNRVVVGEGKIKVTGSKSQIENALVAKLGTTEVVPRFDRYWCPERDSNSRPAV